MTNATQLLEPMYIDQTLSYNELIYAAQHNGAVSWLDTGIIKETPYWAPTSSYGTSSGVWFVDIARGQRYST